MSNQCTYCNSDLTVTGVEYVKKYDVNWDDENNRFVKSSNERCQLTVCKKCNAYVDITWAEE